MEKSWDIPGAVFLGRTEEASVATLKGEAAELQDVFLFSGDEIGLLKTFEGRLSEAEARIDRVLARLHAT